MKEKVLVKRVFKSLLAVLCSLTMVCGSVLTNDISISKASETTLTGREPIIKEYENATPGIAPGDVPDGYVFAGWYKTGDNCVSENALRETGRGYAKFVDKDIFGVKTQITANAVATDNKANIRFVTSVDSVQYKKVGFVFSINGKVSTCVSNDVYTTLYAVDSSTNEPFGFSANEVFSGKSLYFKAYKINNIPNISFGTVITARACWTTQDGTVVYGDMVKKTVDMNIFEKKSVDSAMIFNCNTTEELTNTEGVVSVTKPNYKEGSGAFKSFGAATEWVILTLDGVANINKNVTGGELAFWMYIDDVAPLKAAGDKMYVELSHDPVSHDTAGESQWSYDVSQLQSGWNDIRLPFNKAQSTLTGENFRNIKYFRVFHLGSSSDNVEVIVDDIRAIGADGSAITITNCDSMDGISVACGGGRSIGLTGLHGIDNIDYKEGAAALQVVGDADTQVLYQMKKKAGTEVDASRYKNGYLQFWMYVNDVTKLDSQSVIVELSSGGKFDTQEMQWTVSLRNGWNKVELSMVGVNPAGDFNYLNVNFLRIFTTSMDDRTGLVTRLDAVRIIGEGTLSDCDTLSDYSNSGGKVGVTVDEYKQGTGALKCTGSNSVWFELVKGTARNFTAYKSGRLQFWLYINDTQYLSTKDVSVEISSSGKSDTAEKQWGINPATLKNGWNQISLPLSLGTTQTGFDYSSINYFRIYQVDCNTALTTIIDGIRAVENEATVVNTTYPTEDVVIADIIPTDMTQTYAVDKTGQTDSTAGIQKALDDCAAAGGGTVYLPEGTYKITGQIDIPAYVTLRGDWYDPDLKTKVGTIINVDITTSTIANPTEHGVFELGGSGGVVGLTIYYPNQSVSSPKAYPYTFYVDGLFENYMLSTVRNVTVINGYRGIGATTPTGTTAERATSHESLQIDNFKGTFLNCGIELYNSADVGTVNNVSISNKYWNDFNGSTVSGLADYTKNNTVGLILGDVEWTDYTNITVDGCKYGVQTVVGRRTDDSNSLTQFTGAFYNLKTTNCQTGVRVDKVDTRWGFTIANSSIAGSTYSIDNNTKGVVKLCDVSLSGTKSESTSGTIITDDTGIEDQFFDDTITYQKPVSAMVVANLLQGEGDTSSVSGRLQKYLNYVGKLGGGVVYVPGGIYYLNEALTVPAGVELRGSSTVATREQLSLSNGTVFLIRYGDEGGGVNSPAVITLAGKNAGINGIRMIYQANGPYTNDTNNKNLQTPYAVRGQAEGVYIVNSLIVAAAYGVDFRNCDNHYIEGVTTCCYYNAYRLGGKGGTIRGCLQNGTALSRMVAHVNSNNWIIPTEEDGETLLFTDLIYPILKPYLHCIILDNAEGERVYNNFAYGTMTMLSNIDSTDTKVLNLGTDRVGLSSSQIVMDGGSLFGVNILHSNTIAGEEATPISNPVNSQAYKYIDGTLSLHNRLTMNMTGHTETAKDPAVTPVLTNCNSTSDLNNSVTLTTQSGQVKEGTGAFIKSGTGQIRHELKLKTAKNLSWYSEGRLHLWIYVNNVSYLDQTSALSIEMNSSGAANDSNEIQWNYDLSKLKNGWNELYLNVESGKLVGTVNFSAINYLRVYQGGTGQNASLITILDDVRMLDSVERTGSTNDKMILSCDNTTGIRGNATVSTEQVVHGTGAYKTTRSSQVLWDLAFDKPVNIEPHKNGTLRLRLYISDVSKLNDGGGMRIELGSGARADSEELQWNIPKTSLTNGWNYLILKFSDANRVDPVHFGGISYLRVYDAGASGSYTAYLDYVYASTSVQ